MVQGAAGKRHPQELSHHSQGMLLLSQVPTPLACLSAAAGRAQVGRPGPGEPLRSVHPPHIHPEGLSLSCSLTFLIDKHSLGFFLWRY